MFSFIFRQHTNFCSFAFKLHSFIPLNFVFTRQKLSFDLLRTLKYHIYSWQFTNFRSKFSLFEIVLQSLSQNVSHENVEKLLRAKHCQQISQQKLFECN